jgi:hypothetical protein
MGPVQSWMKHIDDAMGPIISDCISYFLRIFCDCSQYTIAFIIHSRRDRASKSMFGELSKFLIFFPPGI